MIRLWKIALLLIACQATANEQTFMKQEYPKGYFIWPVKAKVGIVANFGELRPNHFHMGLDCQTDQRENVPVIAAADGYVSKINIDPTGFGRTIYINHPNGLTTVYAHLNDFEPGLEAYVKSVQYKQKTWRIQFDVPAGKFPVEQGQFIAYSGNTGGSQGPHLHFEIRETATDQVLNPLLFGFPIEDQVAPDIIRLAIYDRTKSTYLQEPMLVSVKKKGDNYETVTPMIRFPSNRVSFAITAQDRVSGSTNPNGIYKAEYWADGEWTSGFEMDRISYTETRYLNGHIDHRIKTRGGPYLQHVTPLPGYQDSIYRTKLGTDGILTISDEKSAQVRLRVTDTHGNYTDLNFAIQVSETISTASSVKRDGKLFVPRQANIYETDNILLYLKDSALYDNIYFQHQMKNLNGRIIHDVHDGLIPVQSYFPIFLKPNQAIHDTGRWVMKQTYGAKERYQRANSVGNWFRAYFRDFGTFELIHDTIAPIVTPLWGFHTGSSMRGANRMAFSVTDNTKEIATFTALLDGEWLLFSNDKGRNFVHIFDEKTTPGEHSLELIVVDLAGNTTRKTYRFTR